MKRFEKITSESRSHINGFSTIFSDEEKRKQWEEVDPRYKKYIERHLDMIVKDMSNQIAIEILANVLKDLILRVEELEDKNETE